MTEPQAVPKKAAEPVMSFTPTDLANILTQVLAEAKKPVVTEQQLKEQEFAQQMRKDNADSVRLQIRNRQAFQDSCNHKRRDGTSRCVYIKGSGTEPDASNFLICQMCQKLIYPWQDSAMFNEHYQMGGANGDVFI